MVKVLRESVLFLWKRPALLGATASVNALQGVMLLRIEEPWMSLLDVLASILVEPFIVRYIGDQLTTPERPLGQSLQEAAHRVPANLGASVLALLAVMLGALFFCIPGLFLLVAFAPISQVVVLNGVGAIDALGDSWRRTRHHRWQWGLLMLILMLLIVGSGLATDEVKSAMEEWGRPGTLLGTVIEHAVVGMCGCLLSTALTFSYLRLSGQWMGERQGR